METNRIANSNLRNYRAQVIRHLRNPTTQGRAVAFSINRNSFSTLKTQHSSRNCQTLIWYRKPRQLAWIQVSKCNNTITENRGWNQHSNKTAVRIRNPKAKHRHSRELEVLSNSNKWAVLILSEWLNNNCKIVAASLNKDQCSQSSNSLHQSLTITIMAPRPPSRRTSNSHWLICSKTKLVNKKWMMMIIVMTWSSKILISNWMWTLRKLRVMSSHLNRRSIIQLGPLSITRNHQSQHQLPQFQIRSIDRSQRMFYSRTRSCKVKKWYGSNKLERQPSQLHRTITTMLKMSLTKCCGYVIVKSPVVSTSNTQTP